MTKPDDHKIEPLDYGRQASHGTRIAKFIGGMLVTLVIMSAGTILFGIALANLSLVLAFLIVLLAAGICGAMAMHLRRRQPALAAGMWTGLLLGLLYAGVCFVGLTGMNF